MLKFLKNNYIRFFVLFAFLILIIVGGFGSYYIFQENERKDNDKKVAEIKKIANEKSAELDKKLEQEKKLKQEKIDQENKKIESELEIKKIADSNKLKTEKENKIRELEDKKLKKQNAQLLPEYKVLKRDAQELTGNYYKVTNAKVLQIIIEMVNANIYDLKKDGLKVPKSTVILQVTKNQNDFYTDPIYVTFDGKIDVFEGDIISNWTLLADGEKTYAVKSGGEITIPSFIIPSL